MNEYEVYALDSEGFELRYDYGFSNKKIAIKRGQEFLNDPELINTGIHKVEIRDKNNEVEWDKFA